MCTKGSTPTGQARSELAVGMLLFMQNRSSNRQRIVLPIERGAATCLVPSTVRRPRNQRPGLTVLLGGGCSDENPSRRKFLPCRIDPTRQKYPVREISVAAGGEQRTSRRPREFERIELAAESRERLADGRREVEILRLSRLLTCSAARIVRRAVSWSSPLAGNVTTARFTSARAAPRRSCR